MTHSVYGYFLSLLTSFNVSNNFLGGMVISWYWLDPKTKQTEFTECIRDLDWTLISSKMAIYLSYGVTFNVSNNFLGGPSLKPNHYNQDKLVQISDTHGISSNWKMYVDKQNKTIILKYDFIFNSFSQCSMPISAFNHQSNKKGRRRFEAQKQNSDFFRVSCLSRIFPCRHFLRPSSVCLIQIGH